MSFSTARNVAELLRMRVASSPHGTALTWKEQSITWLELYQRAYRLHLRLQATGLRRGDVVGILAPHSPGQVIALFAIAMSDGIFSVVSPLLKPDQVKHQVEDAAMTAIIGEATLVDAVTPLLEHLENHVEVISPWGEPEDSNDPPPEVDLERRPARNTPTDVSNIIYTSGSTGRPKGVVVPNRTLLDGARIVSDYLRIGPEDSILSILPLGFDYGLNQLMTAVYRGARLVFHRYLLPHDLLAVLQAEAITAMAAVPSMWPNLLSASAKSGRTYDLSNLRYVTTAGGPHSPDLLDRLDRFFSHSEIIVMYGLTESFRSTWLPYSEMRRRPGSIGRAVPEVEILVFDKGGEPVEPGEKGELIHRGAFVTYGYLNCPELTAERFINLQTAGSGCVPEKAVRSGDLVSLDADGYVYFHGRLDRQIKSGGYRVSPDEVAEAMLSLPGIHQAAVVGIADPVLGQSIAAAFETSDSSPLAEARIRSHLFRILPGYAVPKLFAFYEQLPLTTTGKIDYGAVSRDLYQLAASQSEHDVQGVMTETVDSQHLPRGGDSR